MSGSSPTKDKILAKSRELFNSEGFGALAAVDIANHLAMSPGNLYYHFKGKAEIAAALLAVHIGELEAIKGAALEKCTGPDATIETAWTWVHILVEEAWDARFAYREPLSVVRADARLANQIRHMFAVQHDAAFGLLHALRASKAIIASDEAFDGLVNQVALGLAFQLVRMEFDAPVTEKPRALIARAAALIMLPITGFISPDHEAA
jgi:AcrR family transcriptional regulator